MFTDIFIRYFGMMLVIFVLSYLYGKANPFNTFAISLLQSVAVAYLVVFCGGEILKNVQQIFQGNMINIIGIILGAMLFLRFIPRYSVLARIPVAFSVGTMLALSLRTVVFTDVIGFARSAIQPLFTLGQDAYQNFVKITTPLFVVTIIFFFIYTFPVARKGPIGMINKLGEIFLYGALGGIASNTLLGYMNSASATIGNYLTPMSDAVIFIITGITVMGIIIALDKRKILDKYVE